MNIRKKKEKERYNFTLYPIPFNKIIRHMNYQINIISIIIFIISYNISNICCIIFNIKMHFAFHYL